MRTLQNKQRIKFNGVTWAESIRFGIDFYRKGMYSTEDSMERYNRVNHTEFGVLAFSVKAGSSLMADFPGKAEMLRKEREEHENAISLEDGEIVESGGYLFRVSILRNWANVSDPVHFQILGKAE